MSREERIKEIQRKANPNIGLQARASSALSASQARMSQMAESQQFQSGYVSEEVLLARKALKIIDEQQEEIDNLKEELSSCNYELKYQTDMRKLELNEGETK